MENGPFPRLPNGACPFFAQAHGSIPSAVPTMSTSVWQISYVRAKPPSCQAYYKLTSVWAEPSLACYLTKKITRPGSSLSTTWSNSMQHTGIVPV